MTLVRIGQFYLNLDRVTCIQDLSTRDDAGQPVPGPLRLCFGEGRPVEVHAQAGTLRAWLNAQAQAVEPM